MRKSGIRLKANLELQLGRSLASERTWRLQVVDSISHVMVLEVELDDEGFSDLMSTAQAHGTGVIYQSPNHGKRAESKSIQVLVPKGKSFSNEVVVTMVRKAQAAENKTVEGWVVVTEERWNGHRYDAKTGLYTLHAQRWVPVEDGDA